MTAAAFKTPPLLRTTPHDTSIGLQLSPPLAESTKIENIRCSENKTNSQKRRRVRRNYDLFKVGHAVDKKDGVLDSNGNVISAKDRLEALFKPVNDGTSKEPTVTESPSSSSEGVPEELPPDPRYPTLLKSSITSRDVYNTQRLVTRLQFIKSDMDKMVKETSPRIEQKIKLIGERKKEIMEMCKQKLERIDRDMEKHKFPSLTDVTGERSSSNKRSSVCDLSIEARPASSSGSKSTNKTEKSTGTALKRRRTMCGNMSIMTAFRPRGVIVTTSLHEHEQLYVTEGVGKLGGFTTQEEVSRTTTHLICGKSRRTLNVLRAICRGCWIVTTEWVSASLDAGEWVPEIDYEAIDFFTNCRTTRIARQESDSSNKSNKIDKSGRRQKRGTKLANEEDEDFAVLGLSCVLPILASAGNIYVSPDISSPKNHDLVQIIRLCSGHITRSLSDAKIALVASRPKNVPPSSCAVVTKMWLFDSIMSCRLLPTDGYRI